MQTLSKTSGQEPANMKFFLVFMCLLFSPVVLRSDEGVRFAPLSDGERLAYAIHGNDTLELYVVKNNNLNDISKIASWENVEQWQGIQFACDYTICFFAIKKDNGEYVLYCANGLTGETRCISTVLYPFRVSHDGKFVCFIDPFLDFDTANIVLFDVDKKEIVKKFKWKTNKPVNAGWQVYRQNSMFRIYGMWEGGDICAVAILDPNKKELTISWDKTDSTVEEFLPKVKDRDWHDDIIIQSRNPNVKLQRAQ